MARKTYSGALDEPSQWWLNQPKKEMDPYNVGAASASRLNKRSMGNRMMDEVWDSPGAYFAADEDDWLTTRAAKGLGRMTLGGGMNIAGMGADLLTGEDRDWSSDDLLDVAGALPGTGIVGKGLQAVKHPFQAARAGGSALVKGVKGAPATAKVVGSNIAKGNVLPTNLGTALRGGQSAHPVWKGIGLGTTGLGKVSQGLEQAFDYDLDSDFENPFGGAYEADDKEPGIHSTDSNKSMVSPLPDPVTLDTAVGPLTVSPLGPTGLQQIETMDKALEHKIKASDPNLQQLFNYKDAMDTVGEASDSPYRLPGDYIPNLPRTNDPESFEPGATFNPTPSTIRSADALKEKYRYRENLINKMQPAIEAWREQNPKNALSQPDALPWDIPQKMDFIQWYNKTGRPKPAYNSKPVLRENNPAPLDEPYRYNYFPRHP